MLSFKAYDPKAMENVCPLLPREVVLCSSALAALEEAQAVILVTEWQEFSDLPWKEMAGVMTESRFVFDGRNALDRQLLMKLGFKYRGVGLSGSRRKSE